MDAQELPSTRYKLEEGTEVRINFRSRYTIELPKKQVGFSKQSTDRTYTFTIKGRGNHGQDVQIAFVWQSDLVLTENNGIVGPELEGGLDPSSPTCATEVAAIQIKLRTIQSGTASFLLRSSYPRLKAVAPMWMEDLQLEDPETGMPSLKVCSLVIKTIGQLAGAAVKEPALGLRCR